MPEIEVTTLSAREYDARTAELVVVIDVFRAFSTSCYVMAQNPDRLVPVQEVEEAMSLRAQLGDAVLIGERYGNKLDGFDYGNSPTEILGAELSGRVCVHTTTAGTRGLMLPDDGARVITGSFVNASAIERYIRAEGLTDIMLLCTGDREHAEEDFLFADYLTRRLHGEAPDFAAIPRRLEATTGRAILSGSFAPPEDFDRCLALDRFPFVLRRERSTDPRWRYELSAVRPDSPLP